MEIKVLIVEDEPMMMRLFRECLAQEGYELLETDNIAEALKIIETQKPHVAIIDIFLKGGMGTGMVILEEIRRRHLDIEVIMETLTLTDESYEIGARKLGAHSYLCKPFDLDVLKAAVKDAAKRFET